MQHDTSPRRLTDHERAVVAADRRWGPPRRLHIGDLTPDQRRLVQAYVAAQREHTSSAADSSADAA